MISIVLDSYRDICDKNYVSYPAGTTPVIATTKVTRQNQRSCKCVIVTSNSLAYMLLNVVRMGALYDGDNITFYLHGAGFPYSTNYSKNYLLPSKNYTATSNQTPTIRLVSPTRNIEGRSRVFIRVVHGEYSSRWNYTQGDTMVFQKIENPSEALRN